MKRIVLVCLLAWLPAVAGEEIVLSTGFRLYADRHEIDGANIHVFNGESVTSFPASAVVSIEKEDYVPSPPSPSPALPAATTPVLDPRELVTLAALRHGLPPDLLHSIAQVESGYRQNAVSPKGAMGIMQLMPQTAKELAADAADARQNVDAGARYLRELLIRYIDDPYQLRKALAAYNAGPGAVDRYGGIPPYSETIRYVGKVLEKRRQLTK